MVKKNRRSCLKGRPAVLGIKTGMILKRPEKGL